jgi:hypothetical protein
MLPVMVAAQSPLSAFSVLLLGQGFSDEAEFQTLIKQAFWPRLIETNPFQSLDHPIAQNRMFFFYDYGEKLDLRIAQDGNRLSMSAVNGAALTTFLQNHTVQSDVGSPVNGSQVWPTTVRSGRNGSLIATILKGKTPGELYQLDASGTYPTPLVGAVAAGDDWMMTIIRAIGSLYAGLGDEYSLDDQINPDGTTTSYDKFPLAFFAPFPNLIAYTDDQLPRLMAGDPLQTTLGCLPPAFKVNDKTTVSFVEYGKSASGPINPSALTLYEGGAGYRHNIARGYEDCLMRRRPGATGSNAVQSPIKFCNVCCRAIEGAMRGDPAFDLSRAKRITIDKQQTVYDLVNWGTIKKSTGRLAITPLSGAKNGKPRWAFAVQADAGGVKITQLQLLDRDLGQYPDPFAAAVNIVQEITFGDLSVTWDGDSNPTPLTVANAFTSSVPPAIETAGSDPAGIYQNGVKVTLTWDFPDKRPVQAAFTFVTRGQKNDFDPGGAVVACRFYPQIAMRVLDPVRRTGKTRPRASSLRGSITVICCNAIPASVKPPGLEEFGTGTIQGSFFADSNSTTYDSVYTPDPAQIARGIAWLKGIRVPYFGLWESVYKSGRLLASVGRGTSYSPAVNAAWVGGTTAYYGYKYKSGPPLPYWSWLFDSAAPALSQSKELTAATYATGENTVDGAHRGDLPRQTTLAWPTDSAYQMRIQKVGRQGQYDNIHIHATMPPMRGMNMQLVPAPFCGDMCMHLHWRWGNDSVSSIAAPYAFLGWGGAPGQESAHSSLGAPLIPPNQHLRVVATPAADQTTLTLTYDVTALSPAIKAWQVFMEQGMAIAYRYAIGGLGDFCSPLNAITFPELLLALGVLEQDVFATNGAEKERQCLLAMRTNPAQLDAAIRRRFHDIYARLRYYDKARDGFDSEQIPTYNKTVEDF